MAVKWSSQPKPHRGRSGKTMQQYEHDGVVENLVSAHLEDQPMGSMKILCLNIQSINPTINPPINQSKGLLAQVH